MRRPSRCVTAAKQNSSVSGKGASGGQGHAQNYHLTLDSGVIGIDKCVDIIAELY